MRLMAAEGNGCQSSSAWAEESNKKYAIEAINLPRKPEVMDLTRQNWAKWSHF